ncbi:hypothetical protein NQK81_13295 [Amycolatopsis roodepoortensis]|uniref:hypothetical protein n=1 Tax=Amycolatopsis roodepoortensis TaxID=700274 RepID=UPI00214AD6B5|nr:hypothetical protein [Amycolatopsis roodepoortensis]UUV34380.1 hypothetical protein NQK81_13295 [Amycolatopsis roodepoortensis]
MGKFVLFNARIFGGSADLTSSSNKVDLASEAAAEDATTFGSEGWKEVRAGLCSTEIEAGGHWEAGDPSKVDDSRYAGFGGVAPWTFTAGGAAAGTVSYFTNGLSNEYTLLGEVGKMVPWTAKAKGTWPLVRGQIAHDPGTARTATGTGAGAELGAVAAGKQLYASLHVLSIAGTAAPSITVEIESDDAAGFASPTTRLSFAAATALGGQILRVPGAITDTWFRPKWTISGTAPSFLFVVAFGIA